MGNVAAHYSIKITAAIQAVNYKLLAIIITATPSHSSL
jgi:hypothetical protein